MTRFASGRDWLTTVSARYLEMAHFRVGANSPLQEWPTEGNRGQLIPAKFPQRVWRLQFALRQNRRIH